MTSLIPPAPLPPCRPSNFTLGALHYDFEHGLGYTNPNLPEGTRFILRRPLPLFQRGLVWTPEMAARFIESAWHRFHLGEYIVNEVDDQLNGKKVDVYAHPLQDALIDGQQRLKALEDYWSDNLKAFGYLWSELPQIDQRHFKNSVFTRAVIRINDEATLRKAYNIFNFGGIAHTEADRA